MSIEYRDVFMKEERFLFMCTECYALIVPGISEFHTQWHDNEKRKFYEFSG